MNYHRKIILLFLLALLLPGCGAGSQQPGRQPSNDWSRGVPIGEGVTGSTGLLVSPDGENLYTIWPHVEGQNASIRFKRFDPTGTTLAEQDLPMPTDQIRTPRLLLGGEMLLLFWEQRPAGERDWSLWYVPLTSGGEMAAEPTRLSTPETDAGDYAVAATAGDSAVVAWEDDNGDDIHGRYLPDGVPAVLATGAAPALAAGPDDQLYLAWWNEGLYFAALPEPLAPADGTLVAGVTRDMGDTEVQPVLGIAGEEAYVFWGTFARSGLRAGTGRTEYVHFPLTTPGQRQPRTIWILPDERQETRPYTSSYALSELVPYPSNAGGTTVYTGEPAVAPARGDELAVVVSFEQDWRQQAQKQMAVVIFAGGQPQGYLPAVKTAGFSSTGTLGSDAEGNLYLTWQEGAGGLNLYYATTAPSARNEINALTGGDVSNLALNAFFESVVGLLFFPLALIWLAPGILVLGLYHMRNETESLERPLSKVLLVAGLLVYQVIKILFMPAILSYVPFSAWLDIGGTVGQVLSALVPVLIFGAGLVAAEAVRRRRETVSTVLYYFAMTGVDAALTLLIYGVNFSGVF